MKALLVLECREGKLREDSYELLAFADEVGAERAMVMVGSEAALPKASGSLYLADVGRYGEYDPDLHAKVVVEAARREGSDCVVFVHSSYGWDLAPRVASALGAAQVTEVLGVKDGQFEVGCCNGKLRRTMDTDTGTVVVTVQGGAFSCREEPSGAPAVLPIEIAAEAPRVELVGYEAAEKKTVDLGTADVVVSAGRGIGKKDNISVIADLAKALGGELGASRPVVDAGWLDHSHQVGSTGQVIKPKLYVACGISGAIQHVAGMKGAEFVVAINKDKDAPIGEVADVLVVADVMQFVPALTERMQQYALAG